MRKEAKHRERGAALPLTLLLIAFNLVVLVALLLYAATEQTASRNSVNAEAARIMALNGIEMAGALIGQNSTNNAYVTYQNITNVSGDRLETKIANTVTSGNQWTRVVENPTALHSGFAASSSDSVDLNYATAADSNSGYIAPRTNPTNAGSTWTNLHPDMFQMKWVDVYKGDASKQTNLIGRFAFWVDDESTKLNVNYSGAGGMYSTNSDQLLGLKTYLPQTRELFKNNSASTNAHVGKQFPANMWPLYVDIGGVYGLTRPVALAILTNRGNPHLWAETNNSAVFVGFRPYYSALEVRRASSNAVANVSEQSQFSFTATMFSREPEISHAKGTPRFDMFKISGEFARTNNPNVFTSLVTTITNNYPDFERKYSLPQFAAALYANYQVPGDGTAAATNFPYTASFGPTNYNARGMPLINETDIKLSTMLDANGYQITTLDANIELIVLAPFNHTTGNYTYFNELGMMGATKGDGVAVIATNQLMVDRYRARIEFGPAILVGTNTVSALELKQTNASTTNWFHQKFTTTRRDYLRILDTTLTGCFALLSGSVSWTNTNSVTATNLYWTLPVSITNSVYYRTVTNDMGSLGMYHRVSSPSDMVPLPPVTNTVYLTTNHIYTQPAVVYHYTSQTRADSGIRGDPRLGLHTATNNAAPNYATITNVNFTNSVASLGSLNTSWSPDSSSYLTDALSPDITPSYTVFNSDAGLPIAMGEAGIDPGYMGSSADIGEVPITTLKAGSYLAWSTPRLWGDGRRSLGGTEYPPDWLLLDCIHTAMLPAQKDPVFCSANGYTTNEHISHGRLNANGLKTYFQRPLGSSGKTDTVMDSMIANVATKDFRWYYNSGGDAANFPPAGNPPNFGSAFRNIDAWNNPHKLLRTNILEHVRTNALAKNANNAPYITPFDFTADLAGNTNLPNFGSVSSANTLMWTNGGYWEAYLPGSTTTSDRRIESLVRSLQQRVTTRGWQFNVYSMGQALQVFEPSPGTYKTNVLGEAFMQAVWERAPRHDTTSGEIVNRSSGGAPPMRMIYMREIR